MCLSRRQNRNRNIKRQKNKLKKSGQAIFSGNETTHYLERTIQRGDSGTVKPYSLRQIKELIAAGKANVRRAGKRKKEIYIKTGERIVVSRDLKIPITYKN
jgi:hypothetical protein